MGASCLPLIDLDAESKGVDPARRLAVSTLQPSEDRVVASGAVIEVRWTAANLMGVQAVATVVARLRGELAETIIAGGILVDDTGVTQTIGWDTTDLPGGEYNVLVRITAGEGAASDTATGIVTINTPATFEFVDPAVDVTLEPQPDPNDPDAEPTAMLTFSWRTADEEALATGTLELDADDDHDSGNEITLSDITISTSDDLDTFVWNGTDSAGAAVDPGAYTLLARIDDTVNPALVVEATGRVTVPEPEEEPNEPEPIVLGFTAPEEDTTFLATDDPIELAFELDESEDVLVDLKIDPDDDHQNGNELTILSQRLVEEGTTADSFDWDGADSAGAPAPDGIYRPFLVLVRGEGEPVVVQADALIFRRSDEDQPLIALLAPAADMEVEAGDFVTIRWRDDVPSDDATIRLTLDDDDTPDEAVETDEPEREILADRDAAGDGVQDSFVFQVPADLAFGRYTVFAYIDRDGAAPFDGIATAAGQVVRRDPDAP